MGRLLGGEHASTPQSGVEAPRLLKRSLPRLYFCCCCEESMSVCVCPHHHSHELATPPEPSSTHSCERSKTRKTGAQLRDNRKSTKNDAKCVNPTPSRGELVELMSRFKVRTARRDTATRSINCAHFSILRNGEGTPRI